MLTRSTSIKEPIPQKVRFRLSDRLNEFRRSLIDSSFWLKMNRNGGRDVKLQLSKSRCCKLINGCISGTIRDRWLKGFSFKRRTCNRTSWWKAPESMNERRFWERSSVLIVEQWIKLALEMEVKWFWRSNNVSKWWRPRKSSGKISSNWFWLKSRQYKCFKCRKNELFLSEWKRLRRKSRFFKVL